MATDAAPDVQPSEPPFMPCPTRPPAAPPNCNLRRSNEKCASQQSTGSWRTLAQPSLLTTAMPRLSFYAPLLFTTFIMFPGPPSFLSPIQSLQTMAITYRTECKLIHLFDIPHSLQSDARLASHLHHLKSLFLIHTWCVWHNEGAIWRVCTWTHDLFDFLKRGLQALRTEHVFSQTHDDGLHGITKNESWTCS